jgi:hypothetical protein
MATDAFRGKHLMTGAHDPEARGTPASFAQKIFLARHSAVQYAYVQFCSEQLGDFSRSFGRDLQELLVFSIIWQVHLDAPRTVVKPHERHRSVSASRIADLTGIARETVRRKLKSLESRRWISQSDNQCWRLAVDGDVAPVREA